MEMNRQKYIEVLRSTIPDFKEERLVSIPTVIRRDKVPYDDERYTTGFKKEEDRTFDIVISDESEDSYKTVFLADGWDLSLRDKGKRYVTYQHPWIGDSDPNVIIGTGAERIEGTQLLSIFRAEPYGTNETADQVVNKLHYGSLTDASVEAYIIDGHSGKVERGEKEDIFYFSHSLLITYGIVVRGANPNAMVRSIDRCMDSILQERHTAGIDDALITSQRSLIEHIYKKSISRKS